MVLSLGMWLALSQTTTILNQCGIRIKDLPELGLILCALHCVVTDRLSLILYRLYVIIHLSDLTMR
jgi:hypothetical protein